MCVCFFSCISGCGDGSVFCRRVASFRSQSAAAAEVRSSDSCMEDLRHGLSSCDDSALLKAAQICEDGRSEGETDTALISFGQNFRELRLFTQEAAQTGSAYRSLWRTRVWLKRKTSEKKFFFLTVICAFVIFTNLSVNLKDLAMSASLIFWPSWRVQVF